MNNKVKLCTWFHIFLVTFKLKQKTWIIIMQKIVESGVKQYLDWYCWWMGKKNHTFKIFFAFKIIVRFLINKGPKTHNIWLYV
jgi:hypothetical protein